MKSDVRKRKQNDTEDDVNMDSIHTTNSGFYYLLDSLKKIDFIERKAVLIYKKSKRYKTVIKYTNISIDTSKKRAHLLPWKSVETEKQNKKKTNKSFLWLLWQRQNHLTGSCRGEKKYWSELVYG